jgi:hypothetical protein
LRRLSHRFLRREQADHSLRSTELVHEAYLRLIHQKQASWQDRAHFFAVSGQIMRRIQVGYARLRHAVKPGEPLMVKVRIRYSDSHRAAIEARSRRILSGFGFLGVLGELGAKMIF